MPQMYFQLVKYKYFLAFLVLCDSKVGIFRILCVGRTTSKKKKKSPWDLGFSDIL